MRDLGKDLRRIRRWAAGQRSEVEQYARDARALRDLHRWTDEGYRRHAEAEIGGAGGPVWLVTLTDPNALGGMRRYRGESDDLLTAVGVALEAFVAHARARPSWL